MQAYMRNYLISNNPDQGTDKHLAKRQLAINALSLADGLNAKKGVPTFVRTPFIFFRRCFAPMTSAFSVQPVWLLFGFCRTTLLLFLLQFFFDLSQCTQVA